MKHTFDQIDKNRLRSYTTVANKLACLSDEQIADLVSNDKDWSSGYGKTSSIDIDGVTIFVKKIPLTDLEEQQNNIRSTKNLFDLPLFYQYGVGSAGFGVWREVAALMMASNWVLTGASKNFPLLYHWRVVHHDVVPGVTSSQKIDKKVAYWQNSSAVRHRIESMNQATSSVVIFSEYFPQTLHSYLMKKAEEGLRPFEAAIKMVDHNLEETASCMADHGMIHFDAHSHNIMTDGNRLYFADFGLALSSLFDLSHKEKTFLEMHKNYDKIYVQTDLVFNIFEALKFEEQQAVAVLKKYKAGDRTMTKSVYITSILKKYAQSALLIDDFMIKLRSESKLTPYPALEIEDTLAIVRKYGK
ncbi:hypothetical protein KBC04_02900 [Candidatus Babeliales bacterium]|nr:hypothetical protein [Candidatus Babeliales bacterium]MBP9843999.1 hypothetical protein [Candidatus Babeliales bacterium]